MARQQVKHKTAFEERLAEEARRYKEAAEEQSWQYGARVAFTPRSTSRNSLSQERVAKVPGIAAAEVISYQGSVC